MKKALRIFGILLVLALCVAAFAAVAVADEEDGAPVDRFAAMGYEFHEHDDTVPKYKIVYPDGTEHVRYQSIYLGWDSNGKGMEADPDYVPAIPDGSTIVLLSDIYYENNVEAVGGVGTLFSARNGRTLNFDFAGHTILCEYKFTVFAASGNGSVLNVYSSEPDASIISVTNASSGSMLLSCSDNSVINFGTVGEHSGKNLAAYTPAAAVTGGTGAVINITDCNIYRMADDHTGYIATRGKNSTINLKGVGAYGVVRDLQFATTNKGSVTTGSVINVEDCIMANIGDAGATPGNFLRWMRDGTAIHFKNTAFDHIQLTMETYYRKDVGDTATPDAEVTLDERCSFYVLPNPDRAHEIVKFPKRATSGEITVPKHIYVNRVAENIKYPTKIGPIGTSDYTIKEHTSRVAGIYTFPCEGFTETATEVSWDFNGKYISEWWALGETPYPYSFKIPGDTEYIQYIITNLEPVYENAFYSVEPKVNIKFYYNFELTSVLNVNVYVPVLESTNATEVVTRVIAGGEVATKEQIAEVKTVDLNGSKFYKITVPIDYSRIADKMAISLNVMDVVTLSTRLNMVDIVNGFLDGEGSAEFKNSIKGFLYTVNDRAVAASIEPPEGLAAIIKERYPENFKTEEE